MKGKSKDKTGKALIWGKYWKEANDTGVDMIIAAFPVVDEEIFRAHYRENIRTYAYAERLSARITQAVEEFAGVIALFDKDGYLLGLWGHEKAVTALEADGIKARTIWELNELGPNAVTAGLAESTPLYSIEEENYNKVLKKYAIYFSPLILKNDQASSAEKYGGIALFLPVPKQNPDYMILVSSIANDLILNVHFAQMTNRIFEQYSEGVLIIDTVRNNKRNIVTHCSATIFEIFETTPIDIEFMPADTLIDPLPKNQRFWSIVNESRKVNSCNLSLSTCGKYIDVIVSTDTYDQPALNFKGIIIFFTTSKRVSTQISNKMGNRAILTFANIIGKSPIIKSAVQKAKLLANTDSNVMILGESGVGKDIFAQAIHNTSLRRNKPFIAVNCGALPRDLIASELFGYNSGAFTGASRQGNIGKFELANGGTIFLDEIGDLSLDLQVTLLRVVENKQFMRLGGNKLIDIDVKIICATNANISELIHQKRFREDLYYRLSTMQLNIPPLRERDEDIVLLAEHFIQTVSNRIGRTDNMRLSDEAKKLLLKLPWQGNVRELQNLMECIVQLYPESIIQTRHILDNINPYSREYEQTVSAVDVPVMQKQRKLLTEEKIRAALEACGNNRSEAARYLGIARKTLYRNMERLGMK